MASLLQATCLNSQVSVSAMEIVGILVEKLCTKFKSHLATSKSHEVKQWTMCSNWRYTQVQVVTRYPCWCMCVCVRVCVCVYKGQSEVV